MAAVEVVVTGIGLLSALGSLESSWQHLMDGKSGIQQHQPFPELPSRPLGLIGQSVTSLTALTQQVLADALQDADLPLPLPDCGVVIGSSRSYQASWEQFVKRLGRRPYEDTQSWAEETKRNDEFEPLAPSLCFPGSASSSPSPILNLDHWLDTLPHSAAMTVARQVGSTGPVLAPMAACATGIWAIAQGMELIQTGQCQRVIAGAVEAPITPLTLTGFAQMGALAQTGAYPFDKQREGLVLGEGAAVFVLESADEVVHRGARAYGKLLGFGLTSDAYHISAPNPDRRSAIAAVKQCLERSHLSSSDIDYIHAHGTATQLNDYNEAELIQRIFARDVPVSSTKGATGHTLGASGALGVAFCLKALKHQLLPPCVGLTEPDFELDLVKTPRSSQIRQVLCLSFGFGGQNAVLALAQAST